MTNTPPKRPGLGRSTPAVAPRSTSTRRCSTAAPPSPACATWATAWLAPSGRAYYGASHTPSAPPSPSATSPPATPSPAGPRRERPDALDDGRRRGQETWASWAAAHALPAHCPRGPVRRMRPRQHPRCREGLEGSGACRNPSRRSVGPGHLSRGKGRERPLASERAPRDHPLGRRQAVCRTHLRQGLPRHFRRARETEPGHHRTQRGHEGRAD
ncbi:hypothetical protein p2A376 (plasmid) [Aromatoleum aromaticum EbN1]|uniref:Uncharacterized protein n=1 Tax=Aromatoleum aromaticum (strain DSM 19018 / LMG 30748 / EbN1) TaxID=76114 RepID=Q5NW57_AROAE|nr:hypothetical protein p2A376 [Aromatoleum aromaticum EbN1]